LIGSSSPDDWENPVEEDLNNDDIDYEYEEQFVPHNVVDDGANCRMEICNSYCSGMCNNLFIIIDLVFTYIFINRWRGNHH